MKERCKDLKGRQVRVLRDLKTRGGRKFPAGSVMLCDGTWRGKFDLRCPDESRPGMWVGILKVRRRDFELLPEETNGQAPQADEQ